jgi:hypothetical protein
LKLLLKKEGSSDFITLTQIVIKEEDISSFTIFIQYLYKNDLIIETENILSFFHLSEKYQAGSYLPLTCRISQEIHSLISKFLSNSDEDGITLGQWKLLIEVAKTYQDNYLIQEIKNYISLSVREYLSIQLFNQSLNHSLELNIPKVEAEKRQLWLEGLRIRNLY